MAMAVNWKQSFLPAGSQAELGNQTETELARLTRLKTSPSRRIDFAYCFPSERPDHHGRQMPPSITTVLPVM